MEQVQILERRCLYSVSLNAGRLLIVGTDQSDSVRVTSANSVLSVKLNGATTQWNLGDVSLIDINTGAGGDSIDLTGVRVKTKIDAGDGNDVILGGTLRDRINAGSGNDRVEAAAGADFVLAGAGKDTITGGGGDDSIDANAGNDYITCGDGADTALGGSGNDTLWGGDGQDSLNGAAGKDYLYGQGGSDFMVWYDSTDVLYGGPEPDDFINPGHYTGPTFLMDFSGNDLLGPIPVLSFHVSGSSSGSGGLRKQGTRTLKILSPEEYSAGSIIE